MSIWNSANISILNKFSSVWNLIEVQVTTYSINQQKHNFHEHSIQCLLVDWQDYNYYHPKHYLFLNKGFALAYFIVFRTTPVKNNWLIIAVVCFCNILTQSMINFAGISSKSELCKIEKKHDWCLIQHSFLSLFYNISIVCMGHLYFLQVYQKNNLI